MTKRRDHSDSEAPASSVVLPPPATDDTDQPSPSAAVKQEAAKPPADASKTAAAQQQAAKDLLAIIERLNALQHADFSVPIDNALRRIGEAIQSLAIEPLPAPPAQPAESSSAVV